MHIWRHFKTISVRRTIKFYSFLSVCVWVFLLLACSFLPSWFYSFVLISNFISNRMKEQKHSGKGYKFDLSTCISFRNENKKRWRKKYARIFVLSHFEKAFSETIIIIIFSPAINAYTWIVCLLSLKKERCVFVPFWHLHGNGYAAIGFFFLRTNLFSWMVATTMIRVDDVSSNVDFRQNRTLNVNAFVGAKRFFFQRNLTRAEHKQTLSGDGTAKIVRCKREQALWRRKERVVFNKSIEWTQKSHIEHTHAWSVQKLNVMLCNAVVDQNQGHTK